VGNHAQENLVYKECRFILPSGYKCKSPALREQQFCYFHTTADQFANIRSTTPGVVAFPSTEDTAGVQMAVNQVLRQLGARRIDRREAGVFFYGLQLAARLATKSNHKPAETVRELCEIPPDLYSNQATILAPEKSTCEPPSDCVNCNRCDFCKDFPFWRNDVEELEDRLEAEREAAEQSEPNDETEDDEKSEPHQEAEDHAGRQGQEHSRPDEEIEDETDN